MKELEDNDINDSIEKYKIYIHDILSNSLNHFKVSDGIINAKLLLYKAIASGEENGLYKLIQNESGNTDIHDKIKHIFEHFYKKELLNNQIEI